MTKEVAFEPVHGAINDRIDEAYRAKYQGNPCLDSIIIALAFYNHRYHHVMITSNAWRS